MYRLLAMAAMTIAVLALPPAARAAEAQSNPLMVPDQSSPRAALESFIAITDRIYSQWTDLLTSYLGSSDLYLSSGHRLKVRGILADGEQARRILDLSGVPPIVKDTLAGERAVQFREILDRIPLPPPDALPDSAALGKDPPKRWRLPGTEIEFIRLDQGLRTGEWVLSPETVDRLPEFYERVKDLPYKPGAARRLAELYHRFQPGSSATVYDIFSSSPAGLGIIIPPRWMLATPDWTRIRVGDLTVWQWVGLAVDILLCAGILFLCNRIARRLAARPEESLWRRVQSIPWPIGILLIAGLVSPALCKILHIGNTTRIVIAMAETVAFYVSSAWLALMGAAIVGELIVGAQHLGIRSLDGQLVRLGSRLVGVVLAIACLVQGADELGIPAYSVLAGLGVGGLAVALAAKDSLANLLGSLLIMFEKPFRVGHYIKLGGHEGTVEEVGFRSTRIRTPDNSLISIPNDSVINTTVENLTLRPQRRQRLTIGITYDTPRAKVEAFVEGIRTLVTEHELAAKTGIQVSLHNLADSSLDVLVIFHLMVTDYTSELRGRHEVLLQIMALAEDMDIAFAFPTRTLVLEAAGAQAQAPLVPVRA